MGKGKLNKWNENRTFGHVFEPTMQDIINGQEFNKGIWHKEVFENDNPITLELGCGKGEYTVALARKYPERNFIGIDIKGHRFWRGAKTSNEEGMKNVAFLRTRLEFINNSFAQDEVDELWITFSDPQPKDDKGSKRITGPRFIDRYKKLLKPGSLINVKTDSTLLYEWSRDQYREKGYTVLMNSDDVYGKLVNEVDDEMREILNIKTYYERRWLEEGKKIKFLRIQI